MKKIIFSSIIALAGLLFTSCVQEHLSAIYDPGKVTNQTLANIPGGTLDPEGENITTTFNPVDFNMNVAVKYVLYASADNTFEEKTEAAATISISDNKGSISMKQSAVNSLAYSLGAEAELPFTIYFQLCAYIANDKNNGIESTESKSNVVSAEFTPYAMTIKDKDIYAHVWVIGASEAVGSWSFDKVYQYLYNYAKTGTEYTGLIDFGEAGPSGGFKFTGVGNWDDPTKNWGSEAQGEAAEAAEVQLVAGNGSKDIKCYSKRFYLFKFNTSDLVLNATSSFNSVGIVGDFNGWNPADETTVMAYNLYYHRFYIDWTFDNAAQLKFAADGAWTLNWGKDCAPGGDNIDVEAGSYRIYFDLNKKEIDFNKGMFGKEEPGKDPEPGPEPTPYKGWGITGSIASAGIEWDGDVEMTENAGVWTGFVTLATTDQFKLRKDAGWDENFGGPGDVEPYVITDGTTFDAIEGGKNMAVPTDGFYKVELDTNLGKITVSTTTKWGVIGDFNEWAGDVFMNEEGGNWVSPAITLTANKGFKIRQNSGWDVNRGATGDTEPYVVTVGEAFNVINNGKNLAVAADGQYIITYNPNDETIVVDAALPSNTWSLIGVISGTEWDQDFFMTEVGGYWISDAVELTANFGFKLRYNHDWTVNRGAKGDSEPVTLNKGVTLDVENNGKNLTVATNGTYRVVYDPVAERIFFLGWSVIGQVNGANWDTDLVMTPKDDAGDKIWESSIFSVEGGFKIRYEGGWDTNFGAPGDTEPFVITSAEPIIATAGGKNLGVNSTDGKYYKLVYNETDGTITVSNCSWSVIGQVNGASWDKDVNMVDNGTSFVSESFTVEGGFKIRRDRDWTVNRGATGESEYSVTLDTPFAAAQDGQNLTISNPQGKYYITFDKTNEELCVHAVLP